MISLKKQTNNFQTFCNFMNTKRKNERQDMVENFIMSINTL